ncbi:MAG: hypothetical protein J0G32_08380, partial [Alphaproteobacteria bacterium]|nr:hypothetical protein [Alphaproteobacteria bacterium]
MLHLSSRIVKTLLLCTCLTSVAMASNHSKPDMEIHFSALSVLRKETVEMKRLEAKKLIEQQKQRKVFEEVRKEEELKAQE